MLRCKESKTEVYIITDMSPNVEHGHDGATVTIRFDKEPASKYRFSKSTSGKALFAPNPINLIRKMQRQDWTEANLRRLSQSVPRRHYFSNPATQENLDPLFSL